MKNRAPEGHQFCQNCGSSEICVFWVRSFLYLFTCIPLKLPSGSRNEDLPFQPKPKVKLELEILEITQYFIYTSIPYSFTIRGISLLACVRTFWWPKSNETLPSSVRPAAEYQEWPWPKSPGGCWGPGAAPPWCCRWGWHTPGRQSKAGRGWTSGTVSTFR